jgi:hypothetical protein
LKPWAASTVAVAAGFLVTAAASIATDGLMRATAIFPSSPHRMSDALYVVAWTYRAIFTVAGGYVTVRLAPNRPWRHAWILAGIGMAISLAGVIGFYLNGGPELGPAWYPLAVMIAGIPCVWVGGRLALRSVR